MKELKHQQDTGSCMQLCLVLEGKGRLYLMVPTYWDEPHKQWMGFVKTPINGKIIHAMGKDYFELQNNFNVKLNESFEKDPEETFSMFKPLEYWETRMNN